MGEFVSSHDVTPGDLATAGPAVAITRDISIPGGAKRWTLLIVPKDDGGAAPGGDPTFKVQYFLGPDPFDTNPGAAAPALTNKVNIVTREDVVSKIRAVFTTPADPQHDAGYLVRLYMSR